MKRKWAGWLSTYSFLLHFRFSPLPQFSVYFSCENPVGSKDVFRYNSKMGQKQKNLWHKNGTRTPLGYLRFHKARTKCSLLKMFRTMKNKIKSYKYLKYFFCYFRFPSVPQWPVPLWEPPMYSGPLALRWLQGTVIQNQ